MSAYSAALNKTSVSERTSGKYQNDEFRKLQQKTRGRVPLATPEKHRDADHQDIQKRPVPGQALSSQQAANFHTAERKSGFIYISAS